MTVSPDLAYDAMTTAWNTGRTWQAYQLAANLREWIQDHPREAQAYRGRQLANILAVERAARQLIEFETGAAK